MDLNPNFAYQPTPPAPPAPVPRPPPPPPAPPPDLGALEGLLGVWKALD